MGNSVGLGPGHSFLLPVEIDVTPSHVFHSYFNKRADTQKVRMMNRFEEHFLRCLRPKT